MNVDHSIDILRQQHVLVSFDVTSLFTQVPIKEINGQRYRQTKGTPKGSPLLHIIANIFMKDFETRALNTTKYKPKLWLRYVDNTFMIWTHGGDKLHDFLSHLNRIHPKIKFTMEIENQNQLPFLDVLEIKKQDGTLGHTIGMPTNTNRYLNAQSYHHPAQLQGVEKTLVSRS
ncbi:hypothetical protein Trydic_g6544 [Trypoxylus dichotomus]